MGAHLGWGDVEIEGIQLEEILYQAEEEEIRKL